MSITIKQLEALSEEFNFDLAEARAFLGHTEPKKRGRPPKNSDSDTDDEKPVTKKSESGSKAKSKSNTKVDSPREKRAPTGYQLFMSDISDKVQKDLKAAAKDGKPARGAFVAEVAKRWNDLSEKQQEKWNTKAKSA